MNAVFVYCKRDLVRWIRGKWGFISSLVSPAAWLIFVGLALPIRFTDNYLDFITPGILIMTVLSASLQGGGLLIMDRMLGFFNKFLALPPPRETILLGKVMVIAIRGTIQSTIILAFAFLLGAQPYTPLQLIEIYAIILIFGCFLSAFSTTLAVYVEEHDSYAAVTAMITMPLFFTSTAMMPYDVMPEWLVPIARFNPLSIAIDSIREVGAGEIPLVRVGVLIIMCILMVLLSIRTFRKIKI